MPFKTQYGSHYHMTYGCHGATIPCDTKGLTPCSDCCGGSHGTTGGGTTPGSPMAAGSGSPQATRRIEDGDIVRWRDGYRNPGEEGRLMVAIEPLHAEDGGNGSVYVQEIGSDLPYPPKMLTRIDYLEPVGADDDRDTKASPANDDTARDSVGDRIEASADVVAKGTEGLSDGLDAPDGDIDASGIEEGIQRTDEGLKKQLGYRSELLFGMGYTEAAPVMAYETFVLQNSDILRHLGEGVLSGTEAAERMLHVADVLDGATQDPDVEDMLDKCIADQDECPEGRAFFSEVVLPAIKEKTGHDIRHVLWLCDCPEDVIDAYGMIEEITEDDIDEHEVGEVLLSDIGGDGKLWGYEHEIERDDMWW